MTLSGAVAQAQQSILSHRLEIALTWREMSRLRESEQELKRAAKQAPDTAFAHAALASTLIAFERYAEARVHVDRGFELLESDDDPAIEALLLRGRGQFLQHDGHHAEAIALFKSAVQRTPSDPVIWVCLGESHMAQDDWERALEAFDAALALMPDTAWIERARARVLHNLRQYGEALKAISRAVESEPSVAALVERGRILLAYVPPRIDEALKDFSLALESDPTSVPALVSRGIALRRRENYADALRDLSKALKRRPDEPVTWAERGETHRLFARWCAREGNPARATGHLQEALNDFDTAIEKHRVRTQRNPNHDEYVWAIASRGQAYMALRDAESALQDFERALHALDDELRADPATQSEYAWILVSRGQALRQLGRYDDAIDGLTQAITWRTDYAWALAERGETYRLLAKDVSPKDARRYQELAEKDLSRALRRNARQRNDDGSVPTTWILASRGAVRASLGRHDEALKDFDRTLMEEPTYFWALTERAILHQARHDLDAAKADYDRAEVLFDSLPDQRWRVAFLNNAAELALEQRRVSDARRLFEKRIALRPENALNACVGLGIIAYVEADTDSAARHFERALSIWEGTQGRPPQSRFYMLENCGLALLCLGRTSEALDAFAEAARARRHDDTLDPYRYVILAECARPPAGLDDALKLLN